MPTTEGWLGDTQATVVDGMNRGREPELISEQQAAMLRNVSIRGGRVRSRPRIVKRVSLQAGLMQGAAVFRAGGRILVSLSGRLLEVDPGTWTVSDLNGVITAVNLSKSAYLARVTEFYNYYANSVRTGEYHSDNTTVDGYAPGPGKITIYHPADTDKNGIISLLELTAVMDPATAPATTYKFNYNVPLANSPTQARVWFCETDGSIVMQDGQAFPLIYDGAKLRRADKDEVPVGSAMAYGNGRLSVVVNDGNAVRLGDIRQTEHQSELKFTETYNLLGGGDFAFGSKVRALSVLPVVDTGSGQGALIVGCDDAVYTLKTQITQRDLWSEVGFQTILLPTRGITGGSAVTAVNQDLYFRSSDGLRSVRTSTADYSAPGLAPLSVEVRHRFDYDTPFLLQDASVALFDNRLLATHSPFIHGPRALYQGLIAFNFDALSGRGQKTPPAFDGEWDGIVIAKLFTGVINGAERCFILGRDIDGTNGIWELLRENAVQSGDEPTQAIETRVLFGDSPGTLKNLRRCDVQFSDIKAGLAVRVYFRPDKYPYWVKWDNFTVTPPPAQSWGRVTPQHRSLLSTRTPGEQLDPTTGRLISCATGFQVRVEWDGFARLDYLQVFQERVSMLPYADNPAPAQQTDVVTVPAWAESPSFWYAQPVSPLAGG
jgi:hypothetical protein